MCASAIANGSSVRARARAKARAREGARACRRVVLLASSRHCGCRLPGSSSGTFGQRSSSSSPVVSTPSADTHGTSTSLDWTSLTLCLPSRPLVPSASWIALEARLDDVRRHPSCLQSSPTVSLGPSLLSRVEGRMRRVRRRRQGALAFTCGGTRREEARAMRRRRRRMWSDGVGDKEARVSRCRRGTRWVRKRWGRGGGEVLSSLSAATRRAHIVHIFVARRRRRW